MSSPWKDNEEFKRLTSKVRLFKGLKSELVEIQKRLLEIDQILHKEEQATCVPESVEGKAGVCDELYGVYVIKAGDLIERCVLSLELCGSDDEEVGDAQVKPDVS